MSLADRLHDLSLDLEACTLEGLRSDTPSGWTRHSTVVQLSGAGCTGSGEDVTYGTEEQLAFQAKGAPAIPTGRTSLGDFCAWFENRDLFAGEPSQRAYRDYRRWAFESAALDLALRQAGRSIEAVLERTPRPLRFCASMGLGNPPSLERPRALRAIHAGLEFKLDAEPSWDEGFVGALAELGGARVIDMKGAYEGTIVDVAPDAALISRVALGLPEAIIEDPHRTPEVLAALEPHAARVSWDAPIHCVADLEGLPFTPRVMNVKPSRFGSIAKLFEFLEHCESEDMQMYGGGQFELGVGRLQIQRLAALFHPDGPNDTAPVAYNAAQIDKLLPASPLPAHDSALGL